MNRSSGVVSAAGAARSCPLFLDLGEQPCFGRGSRPLLLRVIISKTVGREDYGAQLGDAAAQRSLKCTSGRPGLGMASCRSAIAGAFGRQCLRLRCRTAPTRQWPPFPSS
jgi:hypothetical protein